MVCVSYKLLLVPGIRQLLLLFHHTFMRDGFTLGVLDTTANLVMAIDSVVIHPNQFKLSWRDNSQQRVFSSVRIIPRFWLWIMSFILGAPTKIGVLVMTLEKNMLNTHQFLVMSQVLVPLLAELVEVWLEHLLWVENLLLLLPILMKDLRKMLRINLWKKKHYKLKCLEKKKSIGVFLKVMTQLLKIPPLIQHVLKLKSLAHHKSKTLEVRRMVVKIESLLFYLRVCARPKQD
mmetsp:Transcript_21771/g.33456  ORF Transcript_21771/g.33456 Transcript_21771/m.33456 type:complete len:233 (+) Transcript_21771:1262-1960(+)